MISCPPPSGALVVCMSGFRIRLKRIETRKMRARGVNVEGCVRYGKQGQSLYGCVVERNRFARDLFEDSLSDVFSGIYLTVAEA